MSTVRYTFSGAADDTLMWSRDGRRRETPTFEPGPVMGRAVLTSPDGDRLAVTLLILDDGLWHASAAQVDDNHPIPNWLISTEQSDRPYAAEVVVHAPLGTDIEWVIPAS